MPFFLRWIVVCASLAGIMAAQEKLSYNVEWRLINAGRADLTWSAGAGGYQGHLHLYSTGLVSRLFRVDNRYESEGSKDLCLQQMRLQAEEGRRRRNTTLRVEGRKSYYLERDILKNETVLERTLELPVCTHDVLSALAAVRGMKAGTPGQNFTLPMTDGKKVVQARIEVQDRENVSTKLGNFPCIRYEAFLFNDVLFKRDGRLFIWFTDDARRLPVRVQVRMRIHIGTVTFQLDKVEPASGGTTKQ